MGASLDQSMLKSEAREHADSAQRPQENEANLQEVVEKHNAACKAAMAYPTGVESLMPQLKKAFLDEFGLKRTQKKELDGYYMGRLALLGARDGTVISFNAVPILEREKDGLAYQVPSGVRPAMYCDTQFKDTYDMQLDKDGHKKVTRLVDFSLIDPYPDVTMYHLAVPGSATVVGTYYTCKFPRILLNLNDTGVDIFNADNDVIICEKDPVALVMKLNGLLSPENQIPLETIKETVGQTAWHNFVRYSDQQEALNASPLETPKPYCTDASLSGKVRTSPGMRARGGYDDVN